MTYQTHEIPEINEQLKFKNLRLASEAKGESGYYVTVFIGRETLKVWTTDAPTFVGYSDDYEPIINIG